MALAYKCHPESLSALLRFPILWRDSAAMSTLFVFRNGGPHKHIPTEIEVHTLCLWEFTHVHTSRSRGRCRPRSRTYSSWPAPTTRYGSHFEQRHSNSYYGSDGVPLRRRGVSHLNHFGSQGIDCTLVSRPDSLALCVFPIRLSGRMQGVPYLRTIAF